MMIPVFISVGAGVAVMLALQVLARQARPGSSPGMGQLAGFSLLGAAVTLAVCLGCAGADLVAAVAALHVYAFAVVCWFFVYAAVSRSVSLTIMIELRGRPGGVASFEALAAQYAASSRFEDRVALMEVAGFLRCSGGKIEVSPKGRRLARLTRTLAAWLGTDFRG